MMSALSRLRHIIHLILLLLLPCSVDARSKRPNIVLMMADDLGIGDIGIFGNTSLRTPHIDNIARNGVKMSHNLAAASVCTPSRAAYLTGRYPIRYGMAPSISGLPRPWLFTASSAGLPPSEITFAEMAKKAGYKTALIGKWHQGLNCRTSTDYCHHPLKQGFDYFYGIPLTNLRDYGGETEPVFITGYPNLRLMLAATAVSGILLSILLKRWRLIGTCLQVPLAAFSISAPLTVYLVLTNLRILNSMLLRNYDVVEQPIAFDNLTQRLVAEGQEFMRQSVDDGRPFLLAMSWLQVHTHLHTADEFAGRSKHGKYGDNVEEMDWGVGQIVQTLQELGQGHDTFVYFTSDHGAWLEEFNHLGEREGGYNGIYRGGKFQGGVDGGIRVPTVAMFPGRIPAGVEVTEPTSLMDVFPTISNIMGVSTPGDRQIDGHDIMPLLTRDVNTSPHRFLFHYCRVFIHAVRYRPSTGSDVWKVRYASPVWEEGTEGCGFICDCFGKTVTWHEYPLVFNMQDDPSESHPLDVATDQYKSILNMANNAVKLHQQSIGSPPSQYTHLKSIWNPLLQPCCNFPYCNCKDSKYASAKMTAKNI